jgi:hypothetical protein
VRGRKIVQRARSALLRGDGGPRFPALRFNSKFLELIMPYKVIVIILIQVLILHIPSKVGPTEVQYAVVSTNNTVYSTG